jgi:uncharacterized protein YuzE
MENSQGDGRWVSEEETDMTSPTLTYDPDVKALYLQLTENAILKTVELAKGVYLDVDADGELIGIEILNADAALLASIPALPDKAALRDLIKPDAA